MILPVLVYLVGEDLYPVSNWWKLFQPQQWDISQRGRRLGAKITLASSAYIQQSTLGWRPLKLVQLILAFRQTWSGSRIWGGSFVTVELLSPDHMNFSLIYETFVFIPFCYAVSKPVWSIIVEETFIELYLEK